MGSLGDTGTKPIRKEERDISILVSTYKETRQSLYHYECSLPHFLSTPPSPIPILPVSLCLPRSLFDLWFLKKKKKISTLFTLWNWQQTLRPGCSTAESSTSLLMTVYFWFVVCCRLRTETGNSRRSLNWLSRSCSRPSARQRLCLRWRLSSHKG